MNRKQKIIVTITGIFIVLLALVGLTYAYFLTRITGNENEKSISVTTANLELVYGDGNNLITASNIEPGDPITPKTFTVTNKGNATIEDFNIYLENVINGLSRKTDMIYTITCKNITVGATSTECEEFEVVENEVNGTELVFPSVMSVIARDTLDPATEDTNAEVHEYTITLTYKEMNIDQSEDMNKKIEAKVNIYDSKTKFLASEIIKNVRTNTNTIYTLPSELPTKIAYETSAENERILSYTLDDLGTSYYFRGNVEDNYVNFANMCWRIVRIEGDGTIKLILDDQYTTCDDTVDSDGEGIEDYAYTGNWNIGLGNFGYQTVSLENNTIFYEPNYLEPKTDADKSMVKAFYDFQANRLSSYLDKLKAGNWCYDDKVYADKTGTQPLTEEQKYKDLDGNGYLDNFYYGGGVRIGYSDSTEFSPTLKCTGITMNKFKNVTYNENNIIKEVPMFVGAITADEIVYAGSKSFRSSPEIYLLNKSFNADKQGSLLNTFYFSSLTLSERSTRYVLTYDGTTIAIDYNNSNSSFRPAISLKRDVTASTNSDIATYGQPGTQTNPYVIN